MDKIMNLFKKFSGIILAGATAYWAVVGLFGDIIANIFIAINLTFLVRIIYILVGLVGIVKLIEMFKPELLEKATKKKK